MERQLKERLVGAAVLIAVAVIMVPEMFSGSGSRDPVGNGATASDASASSDSGQVKTYRIELQHRDTASVSSESAAQVSPVVADTRADAAAANTPPAPAPSAEAASSSSIPQASSSSSAARAVRSASSAVPAIRESAASSASSHAQATPTPVASATPGGWSIQIGSFATESAAKQVQANVRSEGFSAYLSSVTVGGKVWHRVRVGAYTDKDAAQTALSKLKRNYSQATVVSPGH